MKTLAISASLAVTLSTALVAESPAERDVYLAVPYQDCSCFQPDDNPLWPENRGFLDTVKKEVLLPGTLIDRFGDPSGRFVSPQGVPFEARALPDYYETLQPYKIYEVLKPLEADSGIAAPWFGQPGLGRQYVLPQDILELIEAGFLREVTV